MSVEELKPDVVEAAPLAETNDRSEFLRKTYTHLLGAILAFAAIEWALFQTPFAQAMAIWMLETSWMAVLGAFIVVSWIASHVAHRVESRGAQYLALGGFVVAEAIIFIPMFWMAAAVGEGIIEKAVFVTLGAFVALTGIAFVSGRDFTFLKSFMMWAGLIALGTIVMGAVIGFHLGTWFSMAMIGLAGASILYDTSKIMRTYPDDRYIAAALELFASVALMLWYVLRLFLARR
ncbi:MAG: Bax inhibitor-1 family protein [Pseudomonadota bacterium]